MQNGLILSIFFLLILVFIGIVLTSMTSVLFVAVIFTPKEVVKEIVKIMNAKADDKVVDLGSGDGRVLIEMVKGVKVKAFGYDISPIMVLYSKLNRFLALGFKYPITFDVVSLFDLKYNEYDIIYCNLNAKIMSRLSSKFTKQLSGTKVFSYIYPIEGKKPYKKHILSNKQALFEYRY